MNRKYNQRVWRKERYIYKLIVSVQISFWQNDKSFWIFQIENFFVIIRYMSDNFYYTLYYGYSGILS